MTAKRQANRPRIMTGHVAFVRNACCLTLLVSCCLIIGRLYLLDSRKVIGRHLDDGLTDQYLSRGIPKTVKDTRIPSQSNDSYDWKQTTNNGRFRSKYTFEMRSDSIKTSFDTSFSSGFEKACLNRDYGDLSGWPTASIIITFCDNEQLPDLLHTLHSITQRSPPSLIKEIILIADNTTKDVFKQTLENYCRSVFGDVIHIYRTSVTIGLVQARLLAARMAAGDVIVVLDAHMEVQEKWLEALLFEIKRERRILASITMDWMSPNKDDSWQYKYGPGSFVCYFDWDLVFGFSWPSGKWDAIYENDSTTPLPSPCSIGNWAMDKSFFTEIGELDEGMQMWGGENLDLAIRTWLFGGKTLQIPCSHAAHQERSKQRAYRDSWTKYKHRNYRRLVDVWFDGYSKYFYTVFPEMKNVDPGDLSQRFELKKKSKHNFSWYLQNVYPQLGLYDVDSLAYGQLQTLNHSTCVHYNGMNEPVRMSPCIYTKPVIFLSGAGMIRAGASVVMAQDMITDSKLYYVEAVHHLDLDPERLSWIHWQYGPIMAVEYNLCLEYDINSDLVVIRECSKCNINQRWQWQRYTQLYHRQVSVSPRSENHSDRRRYRAEELDRLRHSWPVPRLLTGEPHGEVSMYTVC